MDKKVLTVAKGVAGATYGTVLALNAVALLTVLFPGVSKLLDALVASVALLLLALAAYFAGADAHRAATGVAGVGLLLYGAYNAYFKLTQGGIDPGSLHYPLLLVLGVFLLAGAMLKGKEKVFLLAGAATYTSVFLAPFALSLAWGSDAVAASYSVGVEILCKDAVGAAIGGIVIPVAGALLLVGGLLLFLSRGAKEVKATLGSGAALIVGVSATLRAHEAIAALSYLLLMGGAEGADAVATAVAEFFVALAILAAFVAAIVAASFAEVEFPERAEEVEEKPKPPPKPAKKEEVEEEKKEEVEEFKLEELLEAGPEKEEAEIGELPELPEFEELEF